MKNKKKRAFTLTELLIVVIVIGVLSAVVLPKFSKVIETRKTTEAEEIMAAVRTEQEQRCSLNKLYTDDFAKLRNVVASNQTQNFTYNVENTNGSGSSPMSTGIAATSRGSLNYTLKMPSFADGRICCEGEGCARLNKNYPLCSALMAQPDFMSTEVECRLPCNPTNGATYEESCPPGNTGSITYTWNPATCSYSETNTCVCTPTHNGDTTYSEACGAGYSGTRTYTWRSEPTCSYYESSNTCQVNECEGTETYTSTTARCGCNNQGYAKYKCSNGHWINDGCTVQSTCECTSGQTTLNGSCGCGGQKKYTCDNGFWSTSYDCVQQQTSETTSCKSCCGSPYYYKTRECDGGHWGEWDTSDCNKTCPSCGTGTGTTTSHQCNGGDPKPSNHGKYCCKEYGWTDGWNRYNAQGQLTGDWSGKTSWDEWQFNYNDGGQMFSFYYAALPGTSDPNAGRTSYCTRSGHYNCSCQNHSWSCPCQ